MLMRHCSMRIVDEGMKTFGDDWDKDDTSASMTEIPTQQQHFEHLEHKRKHKKNHRRIKQSKTTNEHNNNIN